MTFPLITGANGFVGRSLCAELSRRNMPFRPVGRRFDGFGITTVVADVERYGETAWRLLLEGHDSVVHLAAVVHVMTPAMPEDGAEYRRVNVQGTLALARAAIAAGVRRFVYVSSVKVNGEGSSSDPSGRPVEYSEDSPSAPTDHYGASKWEAEVGLHALAAESGLEVVVLRPPLVYGPGVRANFLNLLRAVAWGMPMPFGSVINRRSIVYVGNLADAIITCLSAPAIGGRTFFVCDAESVSTPDLVRRLARTLGRRPRLVPVPPAMLRLAGMVLGRRRAVERLLGSLVVDSGPLRRDLNWHPPFGIDDGLEETVRWFRAAKAGDSEVRS